MRRVATPLACLGALLSFAANASQIDYQLTYSGSGVEASLLVTTDGVLNGSGAYTIDAVSGSRNGVSIDGLLPAGDNPATCGTNDCWILVSDNNFLPSSPFLDGGGFTYSIGGGFGAPGGDDINVYYSGGSYYELTQTLTAANCDGQVTCSYLGTPVTLSVSEVTAAEPGMLALLAGGLASLGLALSRRRAPA